VRGALQSGKVSISCYYSAMTSNARTEDAQRKVLETIRDFIKEHEYPPTIAEIAQKVGLRSKGTVASHLRKLRELGLITWQPRRERTLVITDWAWAALKIVQLYFDSQGVSGDGAYLRRYLLRNILKRPEVCAAIEKVYAARGFAMPDSLALHIAHMRGIETLQVASDGQLVKLRAAPSFRALKEYWRLTLPWM
jgi:hypothetical protein